ncbi:fatty acyl-CoA reductase 1-like isoform X2 [Frieseomelitta varia]|uniref:fatty acyl-CoA reductase 1-like isoform X2 n=1 Tax=Frieseomelitta varia TaxID=561572 RepID=UPI001CB67F8C|nr:fatty acyl-CoA reductase 1-like isoform X2 [Frieseomelitta varia]
MEFEKGRTCAMDKTNTEINKKLNQTNSIEEFYASTVILLTGATGFVGKALLEKLMRVCPRIVAIFILLRSKKNQTVEQRFKQLTDDPVFEFIKAKHGSSIFNKLHPVQGDANLPDLGLSLEDRIMLTEKVNIVFHVAATVSFNQSLADAVNTNAKGTSRVIDLCKELKNIICFIHVSTAYSNAHLPEIEEKVYTTSWKPSTVIDILDKQDKNSIALLEESILKIHPNTYTFTKNLAEQIVFNDCKSFPTAIVRPSIIGASLEEPCPGWVDNIQGVTDLGLQIAKGNVNVIIAKKDARLDLIPVDYVADTILCAAWHIAIHRDSEVKVYNCTSNADPISWDHLNNIFLECSVETPCNDITWYPYCKLVESKFVYSILNIFLHVLPALVMDIVLKLRGKKPVMMKINKRFNQLLTFLIFFHTHEWTFHRDNVYKMAEDIKVLKDSNKMKLDVRNINLKEYITNYQAGVVKYILKEKPDPIKAARRLSLFYWIHEITRISGIVVLLAIISYIIY